MMSLLMEVSPSSAGEATNVVSRLQTALLTVMKDAKQLGYHGRYKQLALVVEDTHDLLFVARFAVGPQWAKLTEDQRTSLVATFDRLSIATYAARFDGYAGEQFMVISEKSLPRGQGQLVESHFVKPNGEIVHFNYVLRQENEHWKIVNIIVNGVSDLALKRAEYARVLEKDGFQALKAKFEEQIRHYAQER